MGLAVGAAAGSVSFETDALATLPSAEEELVVVGQGIKESLGVIGARADVDGGEFPLGFAGQSSGDLHVGGPQVAGRGDGGEEVLEANGATFGDGVEDLLGDPIVGEIGDDTNSS
jgi:hypothetical protein